MIRSLLRSLAAVALLLAGAPALAQEEDGIDRHALAAEHFIKRAMRLSADKKYEDALTQLDKALEIKPAARAYRMRGAVHLRLGNRLLALSDFSNCIELDPKEPTHYITRALIYQVENKNEEAIADYSSAIKLDSKKGRWYSSRGLSYMRIGEYEKAEKDFDQAVKMEPSYAEGIFNRALLRHNLERYDEAIEDYRLVLELKPKWTDVRRNMLLAQNRKPLGGDS